MPTSAADDPTGSRQVVLVLRLVLDQRSRLSRGELLDAQGTDQGRFVSLPGLVETVRRWLELQQEHGPSAPDNEP